jgi:hypothetical protein
MRCSLEGMYNSTPCTTLVTVGNSGNMLCVSKGKYKGSVTNPNGTTFALILSDVIYVRQLWLSLHSITKTIQSQPTQIVSTNGLRTLWFCERNGLRTLSFGENKTLILNKVFQSTATSGRLLAADIIPVATEH